MKMDERYLSPIDSSWSVYDFLKNNIIMYSKADFPTELGFELDYFIVKM